MKTVIQLLFAASLLTVPSCADAQREVVPERPPNIIFIFVDNLGYGDIAPFGSTLHRTPNLDRMAAEGTRFTHFYASSGVCTPSRASFVTGCYAQRVSLADMDPDAHVLRPVSPNGLHPDEITVAEILKGQGYATIIIGKWHLGDQEPFLPIKQGFDSWLGIPYSDDMTGDKRPGWPPLPLMEDDAVVDAPVDRNTLTKRYTERAVTFMEQNKDRPFFLYMPQAMPGSTSTPYASDDFRGVSANGPWGDSVEELDWSAGVILDKVDALGLAENTLVIWTSDNGAPVNAKDLARGSNLPLFGRGYTTAEGGMRVPMIARWPGKIAAGGECSELSTTMDMLPTFALLAGGEAPADRIIDGKDIRPLLFKGDAVTPHEVFYYYQRTQLQAVRSGPWKLFVPLDGPVSRHPHLRKKGEPIPAMLFNVVEDISSQHDVAAEHPDIVAKLSAYAEKARQDLGDLDRPGKNVRPVGRFENPVPQVMASE